jgi:SAM-dependent methyltransferase
MTRFERIYWSPTFDWDAYARLYDRYARTPGNYYAQGARILLHAVPLPPGARVIDGGAGTGALSHELERRQPRARVTAIELSPDMLGFYRRRLRGRTRAIQGNLERVNRLVRVPQDAVLVSSALWDLRLEHFFAGAARALKPGGVLAFNLPAKVLGERKGFIHYLESFFLAHGAGGGAYRRIPRGQLNRLARRNGFRIESEHVATFRLSRANVRSFFALLRYRYPFILFPQTMPYEERFRKCAELFERALARVPAAGIQERMHVFVLRKV